MRLAARKITTLLATVAVGSTIGIKPLHAQIVPNPGDTGTIVTPVGNRFDISGGALSGDNANLFHSLSQFGLTQSQIANFLANPATRNILVRVTGGDASRLDGLIQVSGSNANLFLMNPAGIVFGANATLNVSGSFAATTATSIGFGANWFNASGTNNYAALVGSPSSYAFAVAQPGSIVNAGNLTVGVGQQLTLLGGTVVSSGNLSAPEGQIIVAAVPGQSVVRLSQPGTILSLDVQRPTPTDRVEAWTLPVLSLPQLLTGGSATNATGLTINDKGQVALTGSGVQITAGDVAVRQAIAAPGGTLLRPIGNVLPIVFPTEPSPPLPSPADRINSIAPPDRVLPPTTNLVPPDRTLPLSPPSVRPVPLPSVRQASPPDAVLPSPTTPDLVVPGCGSACPTSTKTLSQSPQTPPLIDNSTGSNSPIVLFPQNSNQTNSVVVLPEALPQYPSQAAVRPAAISQTKTVQAGSTQAGLTQASAVLPLNAFLPMSDPDENLSNDAIDDMNQASAMARRLEAIRKQVQQRWKPQPQLVLQLQYRLLLDTKGAIQQVVPIGQEAAAYLADLKLTPADKPTTNSTAQGFQVIVTLSPNGTVEVSPNSLTLKP